jgi:hypothetical protein
MIEPDRCIGYHKNSRQTARLRYGASLLVYDYKRRSI